MAQRRLKQNFNEVQAILDAVGQKVDKIEGKGLSANDYTDQDKDKLAGVEENAQENVIEVIESDGVELPIENKTVTIPAHKQSDWSQNDSSGKDYIKNRTHWEENGVVHKLHPKFLDMDASPTSGSTKPVTSGGVKEALDGKQDVISDLADIRQGAGLGETAYQKPSAGIPASDLAAGVIPDVSGFITRTVNDLANYYLKSETYTKEEVAALIGAIRQFHYEVYATRPQTGEGNVLYLIGPTGSGSDKYEEYVYANNGWVKIGDTSIDLSGYVTIEALNQALSGYVTSAALATALTGKVGSETIHNIVELTQAEYDALQTKRDDTMYIITDTEIPSSEVGIAGFEQTTESTEDGGTNIWTVTLTNGQTFQLAVKNGKQGNSGYSGAAEDLEVVNNLTDGGATKALSAEMGKELGDKVSELTRKAKGEDIVLDLSAYTEIDKLTITNSNVWASVNKVKSIFVPLEAGEYLIEAVDGLCVYAVLNSSAYAIGNTPDFADGYRTRYVMNSGDSTHITVNDGSYFWVRTENIASGAFIPKVTLIVNSFIKESDVVDDLMSTDPQKPLSARQGNILEQKIKHIEIEFDLEGSSASRNAYYINLTQNKWATSTTTQSFFVSIKPGHTYEITAGETAARFAILFTNSYESGATPDYASGETAMRLLKAGEKTTFIAPEDGYYLNINYSLSGTAILPSRMVEIKPVNEYVDMKILGQPFEVQPGPAVIDARPSSSTFGKAIKYGGDDRLWGFTQYLDLMGAKKALFYAQSTTSSSNLANKAGHVFYDENYEPMTEGAILLRSAATAAYQWFEAEVPDGARYLRLSMYATMNGEHLLYLWSRDADKPNISEDFHGYPYEGERIKVEPDNMYRVELFASNAVSAQSAAIYGKYLFIIKDMLTQVILYDMEAKSVIYTWTTNFQSQGTWHCNQASFGVEKYDDGDVFPVLYISQRNNSAGRAEIQAYRILPTLTDDVITSFTMDLVQTIYLPVQNESNCLGYPNVAIDTDMKYMWAYSRYNVTGSPNTGKAMFTRFAIPALFSDGVAVPAVTLEDDDIQDHFMDNWAIYNNQGAFIHHGKLYMMRGVPTTDKFCECNVIDLYFRRARVSRVDLYPNGFSVEPEGCFYYDGTVYFTGVNGSIYRIIFN